MGWTTHDAAAQWERERRPHERQASGRTPSGLDAEARIRQLDAWLHPADEATDAAEAEPDT